MYSGFSRSQSVYARTGFAEPFQSHGSFGVGCAFAFALSYSGDPCFAPAVTATLASPVWQSTHPSRTVPVVCIVGSSTPTWHETHPALFLSESACVGSI